MSAADEIGWSYENVTADTQVKAGSGVLHSIVVSKMPGTDGVITIYDSLTEAGTVIAVIDVESASNFTPSTLLFDCRFKTGLYVGFDGTIATGAVTINFQ